ncbi:unnamed protein product [Symbiodinium sp. CCMP2592]|nr:unnamed protein product [Symbiodinium sp. CCMP2592]
MNLSGYSDRLGQAAADIDVLTYQHPAVFHCLTSSAFVRAKVKCKMLVDSREDQELRMRCNKHFPAGMTFNAASKLSSDAADVARRMLLAHVVWKSDKDFNKHLAKIQKVSEKVSTVVLHVDLHASKAAYFRLVLETEESDLITGNGKRCQLAEEFQGHPSQQSDRSCFILMFSSSGETVASETKTKYRQVLEQLEHDLGTYLATGGANISSEQAMQLAAKKGAEAGKYPRSTCDTRNILKRALDRPTSVFLDGGRKTKRFKVLDPQFEVVASHLTANSNMLCKTDADVAELTLAETSRLHGCTFDLSLCNHFFACQTLAAMASVPKAAIMLLLAGLNFGLSAS